MKNGPRVLVADIETAPILAYAWGLFDVQVSLNQINKDWHLLSWAAKWLGDPPSKLMYMDQRKSRKVEDDKKILEVIWQLLDSCDILLTQNGKKFDSKKLNARFILNGMRPPSPYKQIDTLVLAKKHFGFTSNKLEYMTDKLCTKYKKLKSTEFGGFELWKECLAGNPRAWKTLEKYNKRDVLALEELYLKLRAWDTTVDFNLYTPSTDYKCNCGSLKLRRRGFNFTTTGKFQRYQCMACGAWLSAKGKANNLLSDDKRTSLRRKGRDSE